MKTLIDGYNLIFECGLHGRRINGATLAKARFELLDRILTVFPEQEWGTIAVVFDARKEMLSGQKEREDYRGIQVYYSIHFSEADEMIEEFIAKHSSPKKLLVVSSDHRIQKAALRRKAKVTDSGDWYDQLDFFSQQMEENLEPSKIDNPLTEAEIDQFMNDLKDEMDDESNPWKGWG
ncbi:MAG: NYN domain-containing protein [Planctomycetota bacterium]